MAVCEICGAEVGLLVEHRAEAHGVLSYGIGEAGTIYYVPLQTLEQVQKGTRAKARTSRKK